MTVRSRETGKLLATADLPGKGGAWPETPTEFTKEVLLAILGILVGVPDSIVRACAWAAEGDGDAALVLFGMTGDPAIDGKRPLLLVCMVAAGPARGTADLF